MYWLHQRSYTGVIIQYQRMIKTAYRKCLTSFAGYSRSCDMQINNKQEKSRIFKCYMKLLSIIGLRGHKIY